MKTATYTHPQAARQRTAHLAAGALILAMLFGVIGQVLLVISGIFTGVMLISAGVTLLLILPVIMLTTATPPVTLSAEGITVQPHLWRARFVAWGDVQALKAYPLLPPQDTEVLRRAAVGRKRYQAASGVMLIMPTLPLQYRVHGFFAGEGFTPVIALTNRTHQDYPELLRQLDNYVKQA
jgi:hypothetical protein